jgi:RNA polymerase sigma-70 factor, ECF subfamily
MGAKASDQATDVPPASATTTAPLPVSQRFRALFDAHASYVSASLARLGVRDADRDDLVSEVFVRVHRELDRYDETRPAKPWLFAFAARVASEHRRLARHRREVQADGPEVASDAPLPDRAIEREEAKRLVDRALDALDDDKRAVFVLHDLDETPVPDIARALGIAEGTAYSRLRAGRAEFTAAVRRLQLQRSGRPS